MKEFPHAGIAAERDMNLFEHVVLSMEFIWHATRSDIGIEEPTFFAHAAGSRTMPWIQELRSAEQQVVTIDHDANRPILGFAGRI